MIMATKEHEQTTWIWWDNCQKPLSDFITALEEGEDQKSDSPSKMYKICKGNV